MKNVWLVTHGETWLKDGSGYWLPDPGMTDKGKLAIKDHVRPHLLEKIGGALPPKVYCGTGRRQQEVAVCLGMILPTGAYFSSVWGEATTLIVVDHQRKILLPNGLIVDWDDYETSYDLREALRDKIDYISPNAVICSGRPVLVRLGMDPKDKNCQGGALYRLEVSGGNIKINLEIEGEQLPS